MHHSAVSSSAGSRLAAEAAATANAAQRTAGDLAPDIFGGTTFLCDEIAQAVGKAFEATIALKSARAIRDLSAMIEARGALATHLAQLNSMNESLGRVLAWHADHQARNIKA